MKGVHKILGHSAVLVCSKLLGAGRTVVRVSVKLIELKSLRWKGEKKKERGRERERERERGREGGEREREGRGERAKGGS